MAKFRSKKIENIKYGGKLHAYWEWNFPRYSGARFNMWGLAEREGKSRVRLPIEVRRNYRETSAGVPPTYGRFVLESTAIV